VSKTSDVLDKVYMETLNNENKISRISFVWFAVVYTIILVLFVGFFSWHMSAQNMKILTLESKVFPSGKLFNEEVANGLRK